MLTIPDLIKKKRDGEPLSDEEIKTFIRAVSKDDIQECQTGAMLMAIWLKGMVDSEIECLTKAMMTSGDVMSWPEDWVTVDKHSTGGVGDKVSLVLAPALAACGCKVPMISGRGLAHTGGTLDKLESIPAFSVDQSAEQIHEILRTVGCCIIGQTKALVPADRVLYALRDATNTVDSLPLITGSIISKKGAETLKALVLDVKFGRAALYKDIDGARELAQMMVKTGNALGIRTAAGLSRMDATIGRCVGNSVEVIESLETLKGNGPEDLMELVTCLGGLLLKMIGSASDLEAGKRQIHEAVSSGAALTKFQQMMEAQGVKGETARLLCSRDADYYSVFRKAKHQVELTTTQAGIVADFDGMVLAEVLHRLGAGRQFAGQPINHSVGAELLVSLGQEVKKGTPWIRLHHEDVVPTADQINRLQNALTVGKERVQQRPLVEELLLP